MAEILRQFSWWSVLDIILIAIAIYHILLLIRGTKTAQILSGILVIIAAFVASSVLPLTTVNWVLSKFYSSILLIIIILFQDDIRIALSRIGQKPLIAAKERLSSQQMFDELSQAAQLLAENRFGALIVLERSIILSRYVDIGIRLNANISKELIVSIFNQNAPIHDGAIIIQQGRIAAAGCFLPLTKKENLGQNMGTRHRAALGISQETDSAVILISEEKGTISLVIDGTFYAANEKSILENLLTHHLIEKPRYLGSLKTHRYR